LLVSCLTLLRPLDRLVQEGGRTSPLLTAAAKLAETEVRRILRRVTAPANKKEAKTTMKPLGRMLAKIMHAAPLPVAEQLIRQVGG
jgi:THO complex subunit 2